MNTIKFYDINGKLKTIIVPGTVEEWVEQYNHDEINKHMKKNSPKLYDYLQKL